MSRILYISEQYLKSYTTIGDNVEPKLLRPAIRKAMDKYIQPILGTNLYQTIENNIASSSGGMSPNVYKTLMDVYILPALKEWTVYELRYDMHVFFRNKGIMVRNSENSSPASLEEIDRMADKAKDDAEWYTQRLIDYLCNNSSSFPEYDNNQDEQIQSQKQIYSQGWYLGTWNGDCSDDTWMK